MSRFCVARIVVCVLLATHAAGASDRVVSASDQDEGDDERMRYRASKPPARRWYGGQIFVVDGAWIFADLALTGRGLWLSPESSAVVVGTYAFGPPIVHVAHGHLDKALGSLGLRVIGPLLMGWRLGERFVFLPMHDAGAPTQPLGLFGFFTSAVAIAIDGALLANEDVKASRNDTAGWAQHLNLWVTPERRAAGVTLAF